MPPRTGIYPLFSEEFQLASVLDQPSDRALRKTTRTRANHRHVPIAIKERTTATWPVLDHHGRANSIRVSRYTSMIATVFSTTSITAYSDSSSGSFRIAFESMVIETVLGDSPTF